MKKRVMTALLAVLLGTALIIPAGAASGSPQALLKAVAYYGDPAQCRMTADQARAFAQVIQSETAFLNENKAALDWVGDGTMRYYAALFDTGNGNPALFFGGGLVSDDWGDWDDSGCFWGNLGSFGIWQYQNGQAVEQEEVLGGYGNTLAIYDSYVFAGGSLGSDGSAYDGRVYPFVNGRIATQPSTTAQWEFINDDGTFTAPRVFQIDGRSATENQFDAWQAKWDTKGLAGHEVGGGVEGMIWGCCPAEYMTITLNNYASAVQPTAYASTQLVEVDGIPMQFQAYALKDANGNDTNYVKLRDVAKVLNGTGAQFQVSWDGAVNLTTKTAYTPDGSEFSTPFSGNRVYETVTTPTKVNGQTVSCAAILLKDDAGNGYTYYKLRDLGRILGFNVGWSAGRGIYIETDRPYSGT